LVGQGVTKTVTLDGVAIYEFGPGEHVVFPVAPGEHLLGQRWWDFGTMDATVEIQAEPGRTYYYVFTSEMSGIRRMTRVTEAEGKALQAKTTAVEQNAWRGQPWEQRDGGTK
jgi:hypothetical protein